MALNKYMLGTAALAASHSSQEVVGTDWWQVLYHPSGILMDAVQSPAKSREVAFNPQNNYWGQQRSQSKNAQLTTGAQRQQNAQALQAVLRQQQAANLTALQQQLATQYPSAGVAQVPVAPAAQSYVPQVPATPPTPPPVDQSTVPDVAAAQDSTTTDDGTMVVGVDAPDQYVVIHVKNMGDVINAQSKLGGILFKGAPSTLTGYAYGKMRDEMKSKLAEQGVDADVTVTTNPPKGKVASTDFLPGVIVGVGSVGALWALYKLVAMIIHRKGNR